MIFYVMCIALTCITTVANFWHLIMYLFLKWRNITYLFEQEIPKELILLSMDYDVALR